MDVDLQMEKERLKLPYKNLSNRYRYGKDDVDKFQKRQYIYIYRSRIEYLKERIVAKARQLLNNPNLNETIIAEGDVSRRKNALIVGTVFKRMKFRQSILYEFADDSNLHMKFTRKANENLTDDEDLLELEFCQQQLIKLSGKINKHHLVTGDIIGVFGSQQNADDFFVVDKIILPEIAQQIPWPIIEQDCYVAFVSGMSLSGDMGKCMKTFLALDALQKWINGEIVPDEEEECHIVQNVVRLVVAGDFCRFNPIELPQQKVAVIGFSYEVDVDCLGQFDRFLGRLLQNMPVDVMPGANDPSPVSIPQQPIPSQVFDAGAELNSVTNPYSFSLAGLQFLGTSGQNVNDLAKCTRDLSPMELMERTLEMGHLFPTVPDTIAGFPFEKRDPLIVDRIPHVYFCGNQPTFEKKMVTLEEGKICLLLAVPKFCESFELILLNLRTLDAIPYKFNPSLLDFELSADEEAIEE